MSIVNFLALGLILINTGAWVFIFFAGVCAFDEAKTATIVALVMIIFITVAAILNFVIF